ncbi:RNA polymerase sigma factor [Acidicapsa acidisoli]|uniref:RNA polymerase sigma factor n=1 Tax=Acidicapsa acidisoli TaxID=1615681 RepID=UPI0021DF97D4|nr:sigma-70 family RNA polymerase sigma factor [Acidicapsa acidisoli]
MDLNEHSAIRAVLSGDTEAYRGLVVRHSPTLLRVALRITGNEADADEVVQEAFLRGYQKLPSFRFKAGFGTWIYRIAVNCAFDRIGHRGPDESQDTTEDAEWIQERLPDLDAGPERLLLSKEMATQQAFAMHALTSLERTAFLLRHVEDHSTSEIAEALGMAPNAVKQAVFRSVQKLRRRLAPLRGKI